jgi:hypothetical protein
MTMFRWGSVVENGRMRLLFFVAAALLGSSLLQGSAFAQDASSPPPPTAGFPSEEQPPPGPAPTPAPPTAATPSEPPDTQATSRPAAPPAAPDAPAPNGALGARTARFGDAGHFVITQALGASIFHSIGGASTFSYSLQPSIHYFSSSQLSLGAVLFVQHETEDFLSVSATSTNLELKRTSLGGSVTLGVNAPLSQLVSVWVRGEVGAAHQATTWNAPQGTLPLTLIGNGEIGTSLYFGLFAPILIHPVSHFFLGLGPSLAFNVGIANSGSWGELGLSSTVGGWI